MNTKLSKELIAMAKEDQQVLKELAENGELGTVEYHPRMKYIHEKNNTRIKQIIKKHGWPSISTVGEKGAEATWLVVQHAVLDFEFMNHCLILLKKAVKNKEAKGWCYAYLKDRTLTNQNKPQIYGTQHDVDQNGIACPLKIKSPDQVDKLRKEIGLEPLDEATKRIQTRQNLIKANRSKSI